jgi:hypothetical protein
MQQTFQRSLLISAAAALSVLLAYGQDSQSMGDVARQARQQKQSKDAQSKAAPASKSSKVITNDEIPESPEAADGVPTSEDEVHGETSASPASGGAKQSAEQWKSQILAQKATVSALQSNIDKLNDSIQFAPGNCVAGCVQWNERQKQKQQEVDRMRSQLETQKKRLQRMQESARQQGYGGTVYDP